MPPDAPSGIQYKYANENISSSFEWVKWRALPRSRRYRYTSIVMPSDDGGHSRGARMRIKIKKLPTTHHGSPRVLVHATPAPSTDLPPLRGEPCIDVSDLC